MGRPNQCNPCCGDITDPPEPPPIDDCDFVICVALIDENSSMGGQSSKMEKWIEAYPNRILFVLDFDSYNPSYDNIYSQEFKDWPYSMSLFLETGVELTRDNGSNSIANSNDPWTRIKNIIATKSAEIQNVFNNLASQVSVFVDNTGSLGASAVRATKEKLITDFKADGYAERSSVDNFSEDFICPFVQDKCCTNPSAADLMDLCSDVNGFNGSVCDPTQLFITDDLSQRYLVREYCDGFYDTGDYENVCPNCIQEAGEENNQYNRFEVVALNAAGNSIEGLGYTKTIEYRDPGESWETLDELEADKVTAYLANGLTGQSDELDLRLHNVNLGGGLSTGENIWSIGDASDTCSHNFLTANVGNELPCDSFTRSAIGNCVYDEFRREFRIKINLIDFPLEVTSRVFTLYEIRYFPTVDPPECNIDASFEGRLLNIPQYNAADTTLITSVEPAVDSNADPANRLGNLRIIKLRDSITGKTFQVFNPYEGFPNVPLSTVAQKSYDYIEGKDHGYTAFLSSTPNEDFNTPEFNDRESIYLTVARVLLQSTGPTDQPDENEIIARIPISDFSSWTTNEDISNLFSRRVSIAISTVVPSDPFGGVIAESELRIAIGHYSEVSDPTVSPFDQRVDGKVWLFKVEDPTNITPLELGGTEVGNLTLVRTFERTDVPDGASMKSSRYVLTDRLIDLDGFGCTVAMNIHKLSTDDRHVLAIGTLLGEVVVYDIQEEAFLSFPTASSLATATNNNDIQLQTFCDGGVYEHDEGDANRFTWSSPISSIDISEDGKTIAFGEPMYRQSPNSLRERSISRGVLTTDFFDPVTNEEKILTGSMYEENHSRFILGRVRVFQFGDLRKLTGNTSEFVDGYFEVFPYLGSVTASPGLSRDYVEDLNQEGGIYWNEWLPALYGEQSAEFYEEGNNINGEPVFNYATRVRISDLSEEIFVPLFGMDVALDATGRTLAIGSPWSDDPQYLRGSRRDSSSLYEPGYGIDLGFNNRGKESLEPCGMVHTWDLTLRRSTYFGDQGRRITLSSFTEFTNPDLVDFKLPQDHFNRVTILEEKQRGTAYISPRSRTLVSPENLTWKGSFNPWYSYSGSTFQVDRDISSIIGGHILYGPNQSRPSPGQGIAGGTPSMFGASVNFSKRSTRFKDSGATLETNNFLVVGAPNYRPGSYGGAIMGFHRAYKRVENFLSPNDTLIGVLKPTWVYVNELGLITGSTLEFSRCGNQVNIGGRSADIRWKSILNRNVNSVVNPEYVRTGNVRQVGIGYGIKLVYSGDRDKGGPLNTGYETKFPAVIVTTEDFIKFGPNQQTGSVEGSKFIMYPGQSAILPICGNIKIQGHGDMDLVGGFGVNPKLYFCATSEYLNINIESPLSSNEPAFLDLTEISQDQLTDPDSNYPFRLYIINFGYVVDRGAFP